MCPIPMKMGYVFLPDLGNLFVGLRCAVIVVLFWLWRRWNSGEIFRYGFYERWKEHLWFWHIPVDMYSVLFNILLFHGMMIAFYQTGQASKVLEFTASEQEQTQVIFSTHFICWCLYLSTYIIRKSRIKEAISYHEKDIFALLYHCEAFSVFHVTVLASV